IQLTGGPEVLTGAPDDWPQRVAQVLDTFRTPDHGYNKSPGAKSGSTYHTFLVGLCFELLGQSFPHSDDVAQFVRSRKRDGGALVEVGPICHSGTNPTAGGVPILQLIRGLQLPAEDAEPVLDYLAEMPSDEGGLRANDRIPIADLLSTFPGLWTLELLGGL